MATPLHHDQPQRSLQQLGVDSKSSPVKKQSLQHDENLATLHYSSHRGNAQQLPPRPLHQRQPQQHLRQRRPESSGPHIRSSQSDHPHANISLEECRPSYPDYLYADSPTEAYNRRFPRESPDLPNAQSTAEGPNSVPSNNCVPDAGDCETVQELESRVMDYKAAVLREVSVSHTAKPDQHVNHENYFACTEDDKQEVQSKNIGNTLFKQEHHVNVDSSEVRHGNANDNFHALAEHAEQIDSCQILASFSELLPHENQAERDAEVDPMASEQSLKAESNSQQLHRELSQSSSDDSFCHISKEAVEREYQSDCHLAMPVECQAQIQPQPCSPIVYDYSRAGVTFDRPNDQQIDNLCGTEKGSLNDKKGIDDYDSWTAHGDQRDHSFQQQDVESPPLFLGFNHSCTRFACGTSKGFRVYDVNTLKECFNCMIGGVGFVELLLNSDSFLLVGGGPKPSFPLNVVAMWDAVKGKSVAELSHKFPVLAVKARQDRLVVVLENEVYVYNFRNARLLFQVQTISNIKGLCALSMEEGPSVLACPGLKKGEVRIEHIGMNGKQGERLSRNGFDVFAHDSGLACIVLNYSGCLLATASYRGTLVRIFSAKDGAPLQELRRGSDRAEIYSLAFSFSSDWLVVSSDKGTVHIFGVRTIGSNSADTHGVASPNRNLNSTLSFIKGVLPKYFRSEWSYAQFKLSEEMKSVIALGQDNHSIFVLGTDGSFYKFSFDSEHGGDVKQLESFNFLKAREQKANAGVGAKEGFESWHRLGIVVAVGQQWYKLDGAAGAEANSKAHGGQQTAVT
ncbi:hypothetical protein GOP47_0029900 [Adiantum capillus-veneris]|nr:hypothetical protein GOP47_0029900 [Adiantum capillus-veneris]